MLDNFRFLRDLRILNQRSYRQVTQQKRRLFFRYFTVYYCRNDLDIPKMGVIVSKRVSKRAVVRNRIKRQVREWFRLSQHQMAGLSLVIIVKNSAATAQNIELNKCLNELQIQLSKELEKLLLV